MQTAVGTSLAGPVSTMTYSANNQLLTVTDGKNNRTSYQYDGHGRLRRTYFPLAAQGSAASNAADFEEYGYDAAGNRTGFYSRSGQTSLYNYDALGRMTLKDAPGNADDVTYGYDLLGRMTSASIPGHPLTFTYDALGRPLTQTSPRGIYTSAYDLAGRRTRLTHPGGFFIQYSHLVTGELSQLNEWNPSTGGIGYVIATFGYDISGRRTSLTRGNGTVTNYAYDPGSRLDQLSHNIGGTPYLSLGFDYNPAGQIVSNTRTNDLFSVTPAAGVQTTPVNGLNQVVSVSGLPTAHDARGNMTGDGAGASFGYRADNAMTNANGIALYYDPFDRLVQVTGSPATRFTHDGANLIAEWDGSDNLQRRYVYAGGELLMQYEGTGVSDRRYFHADERGSIVATSNSSATVTAVNRYDEYGNPASGNSGRFQYTGQAWIPEIGLYYYRARIYNPRLGRFMQTDPIGYGDGMNMYAYVGGDPVNRVDPFGLKWYRTCVDSRCGWTWLEDNLHLAEPRLGPSSGGGSDDGGGGAATDPASPPESLCRSSEALEEAEYLTPEDAGVGGTQAGRMGQRAAGDNNERSFRIVAQENGNYRFVGFTVGTPDNVDIHARRLSAGAGHLHTIGGGNTLSRNSDMSGMGVDRNLRFGVENMESLIAQVANPRDFVTILGAENGDVLAWRGRDVDGEGRRVGSDECE